MHHISSPYRTTDKAGVGLENQFQGVRKDKTSKNAKQTKF